MSHIDVMKQALEALEQWNTPLYKRGNVITALRRALAVSETHKHRHISYVCPQCHWSLEEQPAYRAVKTVHEGKAYYVSEPEQQPTVSDEPVAWMWRCKPYCDWPKWSVSLKRPADSGRDGHKRTEGYEDIPLYTRPQPAAPQRSEDKKQLVGLTSEQWFSWWQVSTITDNTEAEIDFADFLMIALAVQDVIEAKLREKNT